MAARPEALALPATSRVGRTLRVSRPLGHPEHYWFAMGHLAEAEDELVKDYPAATALVRSERLKLQKDRDYEVPFADLINTICKEAG